MNCEYRGNCHDLPVNLSITSTENSHSISNILSDILSTVVATISSHRQAFELEKDSFVIFGISNFAWLESFPLTWHILHAGVLSPWRHQPLRHKGRALCNPNSSGVSCGVWWAPYAPKPLSGKIRKLSLWDTAKPSVPSSCVKRTSICLEWEQYSNKRLIKLNSKTKYCDLGNPLLLLPRGKNNANLTKVQRF